MVDLRRISRHLSSCRIKRLRRISSSRNMSTAFSKPCRRTSSIITWIL